MDYCIFPVCRKRGEKWILWWLLSAEGRNRGRHKIEGQARRSGVFLLELMISILFFCIAAAVGLQLFVKSHCISEDAGNMNMAVHKAAAAAEVFRSGTDMEDYLKEEYSYYEKEDNTFLVSFCFTAK